MKTVTINVEGISQGQWSTFLLELNLMKKAWRPYGVDVKMLGSRINKIIDWGNRKGDDKEDRGNSKTLGKNKRSKV